VLAEPSLHEISISKNRSSPFLAWDNIPIINWGYLFIPFVEFPYGFNISGKDEDRDHLSV
jgi:hypothetical protein